MLLRYGARPPEAGKLAAAAAARRVPPEIVDIVHAKAEVLYERRLVLVRPKFGSAQTTPCDAPQSTE